MNRKSLVEGSSIASSWSEVIDRKWSVEGRRSQVVRVKVRERTLLVSFCEGRLFAERTGIAPVEVVGLHGWARTREDLAGPLAGLNALAFDLPGFGASPEPPEAFDSMACAALIAEAMAALDRPQVLLGLTQQVAQLPAVPRVRHPATEPPSDRFRVHPHGSCHRL